MIHISFIKQDVLWRRCTHYILKLDSQKKRSHNHRSNICRYADSTYLTKFESIFEIYTVLPAAMIL